MGSIDINYGIKANKDDKIIERVTTEIYIQSKDGIHNNIISKLVTTKEINKEELK